MNKLQALEAAAKAVETIDNKHGETFTVVAPLDEAETEYIFAILKKPSRPVVSAYMSKATTDLIGANEMLLRSIIIADVSDMRIVTEDIPFYAACSTIGEILTVRTADLKKN